MCIVLCIIHVECQKKFFIPLATRENAHVVHKYNFTGLRSNEITLPTTLFKRRPFRSSQPSLFQNTFINFKSSWSQSLFKRWQWMMWHLRGSWKKADFFQWIKIIISSPTGTQDETFSLPESPFSVSKSDVDIAENSLFSSGETADFSYLAFAFPLTSKKMATSGFK